MEDERRGHTPTPAHAHAPPNTGRETGSHIYPRTRTPAAHALLLPHTHTFSRHTHNCPGTLTDAPVSTTRVPASHPEGYPAFSAQALTPQPHFALCHSLPSALLPLPLVATHCCRCRCRCHLLLPTVAAATAVAAAVAAAAITVTAPFPLLPLLLLSLPLSPALPHRCLRCLPTLG